MSRFQLAMVRIASFCAVGVLLALPAVAQTPASNSLTFKVQAAAERLEMTVNTSRIMEMPFRVPRIFVGNPDLVRAAPLSPNQIQLSALKPGVTQINVWDEEDRITTVDIVIYGDSRELELLLRGEFPDAQLKIRPLASSVYISGFVPKQEYVGQIVRMAEDFYPKVVNNITVGGVQQILLNVKIMEVSRTKLRAMGVDWSAVNENFFLTQRTGGLITALSDTSGTPQVMPIGSIGDTVRFGVIGDTSFFGFLELLRQNDLAKLMAEPKLTTVSGRAASFNVGGEVPIPIAQSLGTVTVQYKEFGTRVDFVPIALGNGNIRLEVRPDVTEVDPSLRDATTGVPGFRRRFADTAVELRAGQTMAIAGLIYQRQDTSNRGVPWLADLPWVGAAFRRTRETVNEVELVITVTPEFVDGLDCEQVPPFGPGQMTTSPSDVEFYGRGYMEVPQCCADGTCEQCQGFHGGGVEQLGPPAAPPMKGVQSSPAGKPIGAPVYRGVDRRQYNAPADALVVPQPGASQPLGPAGSARTHATPVSTGSGVRIPPTGTKPSQSVLQGDSGANQRRQSPSSTPTTRLPPASGTTREPVQGSLSDDVNLIGPIGYERLR
jgi:pilus assembly protein CpaC